MDLAFDEAQNKEISVNYLQNCYVHREYALNYQKIQFPVFVHGAKTIMLSPVCG
jgi:hypothetical protein